MVVEEWTGSWCGMCVRGIVGMEYMKSHYGPDEFIGLSVHCDDFMEAASYKGFIDYFTRYMSFPGSTINRRFIVDPSKETLENYRPRIADEPTFAIVTASAVAPSAADSELTASAAVRFSMPFDHADFRISFVLTEDEVGPYFQMNTYSGGYLGELEGWEKKSNRVYIKHDNVVRESTDCLGAKGSLPTTIEPDRDYVYSSPISLDNVTDINKCSLIALLIDGEYGEVVNAAMVKLASSSNESLEDSFALPEAVCFPGGVSIGGDIKEGGAYTADGRLAATFSSASTIALPHGIYILRITDLKGNTHTQKIAIP